MSASSVMHLLKVIGFGISMIVGIAVLVLGAAALGAAAQRTLDRFRRRLSF